MKKKILIIFLSAMLSVGLLAGCGEEVDSPIIATVEPENIGGGSEGSEATGDSTQNQPGGEVTDGEEEEEESKVLDPSQAYRSELTNEWIDKALKDQRPVAIMVDNESTALPHYGLTEADVVYEMMNSTANNRVTRLMAIVKDWKNIKQFGSIRSVRQTNVMMAAEWNAVLVHDGGPFYVDEWLARKYCDNLSGGFSRIDNGKAREFTEYVCEGELEKRFKANKFSEEYNDYYPGSHFKFSDEEFDLADDYKTIDCTEIKLPFPHNRSTLTYNEETGTYDYSEYGAKHLDPQHNNKQLSFENVILQDTTFTELDKNGYLIYNTVDKGRKGYYITNGKAVEITWSKKKEDALTVYKIKETGEEITLNTGKTYIALVPSDGWKDMVIN